MLLHRERPLSRVGNMLKVLILRGRFRAFSCNAGGSMINGGYAIENNLAWCGSVLELQAPRTP
jgi:hypothetical protein